MTGNERIYCTKCHEAPVRVAISLRDGGGVAPLAETSGCNAGLSW
jgi:hypothetical protein